MRKLGEFKDTGAPIMQGQIGGAAAMHRGGGLQTLPRGEPISAAASAAGQTAGKNPLSLISRDLTSGKNKTTIAGKKKSGQTKKIEYGSTLKNIDTSGFTINKGNYEPSTPGVKSANILNPERYGQNNPVSSANFQPKAAPRPAAPARPQARPASMALRSAQTTSASKVPLARPASTTMPQLGGRA